MSRDSGRVLLQYNALWEVFLAEEGAELPGGWVFTRDRRLYGKASAVVFHVPSMPRYRWPVKRFGQRWVALSMESVVNYPRLANPLFLALFDGTMTYRQQADVVVNYLHADLPSALSRPPQPRVPGHLAAAFVSNPRDRCGRAGYLAELMRHLDVHAYGTLLRNRTLDTDHGESTLMETLARYTFTLAFENSIADDYVTEKLYNALIAGSVPVYRGARNVEAFLPGDNCIINADDFGGPRELADYLRRLAADASAYAAFHRWRGAPLRPSFLALCEAQRRDPLLRLVEFLDGTFTPTKAVGHA